VPILTRVDCIVTSEFITCVKCHFKLLLRLFVTELKKSNGIVSGYVIPLLWDIASLDIKGIYA